MGSWITFTRSELTLQAKEEKKIEFFITPPDNLEPSTYHAALVAKEKDTLNIQYLPVYYVQPGEKNVSVELSDFKVFEDGGNLAARIKIDNNGNNIVIAQPVLTTSFLGIFGDTKNLPEKTVYPGDSASFEHTSKKIFPGIYKTGLTIKFLDYDILADTKNEIKTENRSQMVNYKLHYFLLIPIVFLFVINKKLFRKIHISRLIVKGISYQPQTGETLQSIAKKFRIKWEFLAAMNSILPPYPVSPQNRIIVPFRKNLVSPKEGPAANSPVPPAAIRNPSLKLIIIFTFTAASFLFLFDSHQRLSAQTTDASVKIKSGPIYIQPPASIDLNNWFIPQQNTNPYFIYKTLSPDTVPSQLRINDSDTSGTPFKVTVNISNLVSNNDPASVIPFSNFSIVTIAKNYSQNVDSLLDTDYNIIAVPSACQWRGMDIGNICTDVFDEHHLAGETTLIASDPTEILTTDSDTMEVQDSSSYQVGDVIEFMDKYPVERATIPKTGFNEALNQNTDLLNEKALVSEIISDRLIGIKRGISNTFPKNHQIYGGITNHEQQSLQQDIFISNETTDHTFANIYSMGFGIRTLLEPQLDLIPGQYSGTITYSLYTNDL